MRAEHRHQAYSPARLLNDWITALRLLQPDRNVSDHTGMRFGKCAISGAAGSRTIS